MVENHTDIPFNVSVEMASFELTSVASVAMSILSSIRRTLDTASYSIVRKRSLMM